MNDQDIRWQQRFSNYKKALLQLQDAVDLSEQRTLSKLEYRLLKNADLITHIDRVGVEIYANDEGRNTATAESLARAKV